MSSTSYKEFMFTIKERRIAMLLCRGASDRRIAKRLGVTIAEVNAVKFSITNKFARFGMKDYRQILIFLKDNYAFPVL